MLIISPAQCRAARALLNWSQPELADKCDMHVQTISNFENEISTPTKTTLLKISSVFQNSGIIITEHDGIRRNHDLIKQYEGPDGFKAFMDDVYQTAKDYGGDIFLLNAKPSNWIKWLGHEWNQSHSARMKEIKDNFTFKITIKEGDYDFIGSQHAEYRWVPKEIWNEKSFYVYGNKIGFLDFCDHSVNIFVMEQTTFSETFKFAFNLIWDQYSIIPDSPDHKPQEK